LANQILQKVEENRIEIRDFKLGDIEYLTVLTNELGYPSTVEEMTQRMEFILQLDTYWTYVAVLDERVVGYIGFHKNYFWEREGFYIKIQALVVKKEYRRFGIGRKLILSVEEFSRQLQAKTIVLTSGNREERQSAHQFYPQMGFEAKSIGYTKQL